MPLGPAQTNAHLARLRELCSGEGERVDLLEAALLLSVLQRDEAIDRKVVEQLLAGRWEKTHSRVVLKAAGRSFEAAADYAPGDPFQADLAFTDAQLFAKFRNSTTLGLPAAQIERCIETVMMLERAPDVRGLLQLLH